MVCGPKKVLPRFGNKVLVFNFIFIFNLEYTSSTSLHGH